MRTAKLSLVVFASLALLASVASARNVAQQAPKAQAFSAQKRAAMVRAYHANKGWTTNVRVRTMGKSTSGKSFQMVTAPTAAGPKVVRQFNVRQHVYATPTRFRDQAAGRKIANNKLRKSDGKFAKLKNKGISTTGKTMVFGNYANGKVAYVPFDKTKPARVFKAPTRAKAPVAQAPNMQNVAQQLR